MTRLGFPYYGENVVKLQWRKKLESQFLEQKPSLMISYTEDKRLEMDLDALRENLWFTDSVAINVCERCAKWQESLGLLASARNAGLLPYAISYNAAISACEKGEQAGTRLVCSGAKR